MIENLDIAMRYLGIMSILQKNLNLLKIVVWWNDCVLSSLVWL